MHTNTHTPKTPFQDHYQPFWVYFSAKDSTIFIHYLHIYDPILFSNSDYNLLQMHLKLPLKYIEVEIDYLNLFMACSSTYNHLRLWICHNSFHLGQIIFSARSTPTQIITPQGNISIAEGGGGGGGDLFLWIIIMAFYFF